MNTYKIEDFKRGWICGYEFEPKLLKSDIEVGVQSYLADECHPAHYHKLSTEYNLVLSGTCKFFFYEKEPDSCSITNKLILNEGDILEILPNEIASFEAITDCKILCIKSQSVQGDKYLI